MLLLKKLHDKLVVKVNNIDICGFVLKTKYDTYNSDLEKKISDAGRKNNLILADLSKKQIIMIKLVK